MVERTANLCFVLANKVKISVKHLSATFTTTATAIITTTATAAAFAINTITIIAKINCLTQHFADLQENNSGYHHFQDCRARLMIYPNNFLI